MPLKVAGHALEAAWWGPGPDEAPTLVLLHEGLGCVALWRDLPQRLSAATGCGVFAYSRRGYGQSDPVSLPRPLTYMQDEAREALPAVLDAVGIRRALLVGHSDGASIALLYAGGRQDFRIAGLVLIAPHVMVEDMTVAAIEQAGSPTKPPICAPGWRATITTSTARSGAGTAPGWTRRSAPGGSTTASPSCACRSC